MKNEIFCIAFVLFLSGLTGCTGASSNDSPDLWYDMRDSLINKKWERTYHNEATTADKEHYIKETWIFENKGSCSFEEIKIFKDNEEKNTQYFRWVLTIDLVININDTRFWEIETMTPTTLLVTETWENPVKVPGQMYRKQKKYQVLK